MSANGQNVKSIFGILIVAILAILAVDKGYNGDLLKYSIQAIIVLAIGEKAVDWYFTRETKK